MPSAAYSSAWCANSSSRTNSHTHGIPLVTAIYVILAGSLLVWQGSKGMSFTSTTDINSSVEMMLQSSSQQQQRGLEEQSSDVNGAFKQVPRGLDPANPLAIPQGQAPNLPSIRENVEETAAVDAKRTIYGGAGDKAHLGGFTEIDMHGISPNVWKHMMQDYGVHSLLDVGCGRGISTSWFQLHGAEIMCVEGSHDAVQRSVLPTQFVVEHDFSRGPWWPAKTYDAVWAVEFLEHVGVNYHFNYITAFRKAALLFVTSSRWGGWHHVEVHLDGYWIRKYESYGFKYDEALTKQVRGWATDEQRLQNIGPTGAKYNAQHVYLSMKVFINPVVAALPEHAHLFFEHGCYQGRGEGFDVILRRPCGTGKDGHLESVIPPDFLPLNLTQEMDQNWNDLIRSKVSQQIQ
jgi:Methyltransferase domain